MSAAKLAFRLCASSAVALCLAITPASSRMMSPAWQERASGQIKSGQVPSGFPVPSEAFKRLTGEWWQWAASIPVAGNPLLDSTGVDCMVGQRGSIWFLAANFGGGSTNRSCTIPKGKQLFFPVVNSVNIDTPNVCGQGSDRIPVADLRAFSAVLVDGAVDISVTLDGAPISKLARTRSEVFEVTLPEDNLFDAPCQNAGLGNVPAGVYSPAVDDGIYVLLRPLEIGSHTLNFKAENPGAGFNVDVTYLLNVVPVKLR